MHVRGFMADVEDRFPDKIMYELQPDMGTTGRFEVTLFATKQDLEARENGTLIWSKASSGMFPFKVKQYPQILDDLVQKSQGVKA